MRAHLGSDSMFTSRLCVILDGKLKAVTQHEVALLLVTKSMNIQLGQIVVLSGQRVNLCSYDLDSVH